jgi:hypothetical protein
MQWQENTFFDHLDKFGNALGAENFGIVFSLASVPWQSTQDRDAFISAITADDSTTPRAPMPNTEGMVG